MISIPYHKTHDFVTVGKIGDIIHELFVLKRIHELTGYKQNLYLSDNQLFGQTFYRDVKLVHDDLYELISSQPYINKFEVHNANFKNVFNLSTWRWSIKHETLTSSWTDMLCSFYDLPLPSVVDKWVFWDGKNDYFNDKVIIHRSFKNKHDSFIWDKIVSNNKCVFVGFDTNHVEWKDFEYKDSVEYVRFDKFSDYYSALNSCKFYVGNLTGPTAMAQSMCKPRLLELASPSINTYLKDEDRFDNFYYICDYIFAETFKDVQTTKKSKLDGIERFISI
jgi:hypothetical protein